MSNHEEFDLSHFLHQLEMDEDLVIKKVKLSSDRYRACPRCGSKEWKNVYKDERGKDACCDECDNIGQ